VNALQLAKHFFSGRAGQGQSTVDRRKNKRVIVFGDAGSGQDCHQLAFFLGRKKPALAARMSSASTRKGSDASPESAARKRRSTVACGKAAKREG
jgi:hypothetical protein